MNDLKSFINGHKFMLPKHNYLFMFGLWILLTVLYLLVLVIAFFPLILLILLLHVNHLWLLIVGTGLIHLIMLRNLTLRALMSNHMCLSLLVHLCIHLMVIRRHLIICEGSSICLKATLLSRITDERIARIRWSV